jgi:hypothetical protein
MNPRIYISKAAKQKDRREAKKLGMTCAEYRAHIAAGGKPAPPTRGNNGQDLIWVARAWKASMEGSTTACHGCGYRECACARIAELRAAGVVTFGGTRRKTHVASTSGKHVVGVTACGKFYDVGRHKVKLAKDGDAPTCSKCQTIKITPPEEGNRRRFKKEMADYKQGLMEVIYKPKRRKTKFPKTTIDRLFRRFWDNRITADYWRAEIDKLEARYVGESVMFKGVRERMETTIQHKERVYGRQVTQ